MATLKRASGTLDPAARPVDVLDPDGALTRLAEFHPRKSAWLFKALSGS